MKSLLPKFTLVSPAAPPPLTAYPRPIHKLIKQLRTPAQVQSWLRSLDYNKADSMRTLESVARFRSAHCLEGALSAAAILERHSYPPLILDMESTDLLDHTLFLYRKNGRYGSIGKSRDVGLDGRKPLFRTIEALVRSYAAPYIDAKACLTGYGVLDLRTLTSDRWRTSEKNVWYVESALRKIPHHKLHLAPAFVNAWRHRHAAWRHAHPDQQPSYYPNQKYWA